LVFCLCGTAARAGVIVDRILALVGEEVVTQSDLDRLLYAKGEPGESKDPQVLLNQLIEEQLMLQEAQKRGLRVSGEELEFALDDIQSRNRFPNRESFKKAVSMGAISWEDYVSSLKKQVLRLKLLSRELNSRIKLEEGEARAYYETFPERFNLPERIRLRQLLLRFPPGASEAAKKRLREKSAGIYAKIRKGQDFVRLVEQYSEGPARKKGGDLGFFQKGELAAWIEEAVFNLEVGTVSQGIESSRGIHLFKLEKRENGRKIPFEKVQQDIEAKLMAKKRIALQKKWLDDLWERSFVEIKDQG